MEKNKTIGHKTINQLCREYEVQDIWALSDVFNDWNMCGHSNLVILHFKELRKCERNLLWRWWNANAISSWLL